MTTLAFLDTETTGLDPDVHQVWEIAVALDDGPIHSMVVAHHTLGADPEALAVSRYQERGGPSGASYDDDPERELSSEAFEMTLIDGLAGATLVGANPAFDAAFLRARWGHAPWHFRLLDVEAYAMGTLGYDRPRGLATITKDLRARGFDIPVPDHSAAADVAATRAAFYALRSLYEPSEIQHWRRLRIEGLQRTLADRARWSEQVRRQIRDAVVTVPYGHVLHTDDCSLVAKSVELAEATLSELQEMTSNSHSQGGSARYPSRVSLDDAPPLRGCQLCGAPTSPHRGRGRST